jgi:hypothetical protein
MPDEPVVTPDGDPQEPDAPVAEPVSEPVEDPAPEPKSFDQEYVDSLRSESAKYRKRAQDAEAKVKEHDQAQMGELEKAQADAAIAEKRSEQLTNLLGAERTRNAVTLEATKMKFQDPSDALAMIDIDDLNYDEETGKPSTKSVQGALGKLAKAKPYLIEGVTSPGSADGGADGGTGAVTQEQKIAQYAKEQQERYGSVPMPAP